MSAHHRNTDRTAGPQRGFSLVELMVAVTIGLVVMLIIFNVLIVSEERKRTTTSVNDINQSGAYSAYIMDRAIRSAGSGFSNQRIPSGTAGIEGCPISVRRGGTVLAPSPTAYAAPFAGAILQSPVLAPVIIDQGTDSDVITVMAGAAGLSEVGERADPDPVFANVTVNSALSFAAQDLVLFGRAFTGTVPCPISQVGTPTPPGTPAARGSISLAGAYTSAVTTSQVVAGDLALSIGNLTNKPPQFKMYGVGANQTLVSYDILDLDSSASPAPVAEGVITMRAIYGIDDTPSPGGDNVVDRWVAPTGAWSGATLRNGSVASSDAIRQIVAVRLVLVMRSSLLERADVQASRSFTVYADLPAGSPTRTIAFTGGDTARYRYRVIESTIPLRNGLL